MPQQEGEGRSAEVAIDHIDQLVDHRLGVVAPSLDRVGRAVLQVVPNELPAHRPQRLMDGGDLCEDVGTVAILLHQSLQPPDLALDPPKAAEVPCSGLQIDAEGSRAATLPGVRARARSRIARDPRWRIRSLRPGHAAAASCWTPRSPS